MASRLDDALPIVDDTHVWNIDYTDLSQVKALAIKMGHCAVIKYPDRPNYNIRHTSRLLELPDNVTIVFKT